MRLIGKDAIAYCRHYGERLHKYGSPKTTARRNISLELALAVAEEEGPHLVYADTDEEVEVMADWECVAEDWWKAKTENEPFLAQVLLTENGPDVIRCSVEQAEDIRKWAASVPGWSPKNADKHSPHPLIFRQLPRYRIERIMSEKGWASVKEMAQNSHEMFSPEQAREAMRNINDGKMTLDTLLRLCKTLDVSMDTIFGPNPKYY